MDSQWTAGGFPECKCEPENGSSRGPPRSSAKTPPAARMRSMPSPYAEVFRSPRVAAVLVLGFSSGLPLALTGSTLQAWLTVSDIDIQTIPWFSGIGFAPLPQVLLVRVLV